MPVVRRALVQSSVTPTDSLASHCNAVAMFVDHLVVMFVDSSSSCPVDSPYVVLAVGTRM
ncbi:hypothetical protein D9611_009979 [Ephemerocybe angulata]|uniref:Uncharacterized protein n=1 Tax=Ephemerocybe angulata TaxID=980116 RepID=A0A8H5C673_9AGAR|nr:hypothetical protein D9611_009979 [Tulosesus angulatus]